MSMTGAGNKQGYMGVECKKEKLVEEGDVVDEGEKEIEDGEDIFIGIKQIDAHARGDGSGGNIISHKCKMR